MMHLRPPAPMRLTPTRLQAGIWEGVLEAGPAAVPPGIEALHQGRPLPGLRLTPDPGRPGRYGLALPIPAEILSDGVQTCVIRDRATGAMLASFAILAGQPLDHDLRAEIELLRAELDLLKRAFRAHCVEAISPPG
ncbi:hypothetical protein NHN26_05835 [Rhodovulum tesquicola]|uniref:hypothetical protein n=1 Tax=Rhodovulum tesquicola TaxID=540254 RepID=UPI0020976EEB|nr:hypothetical protein [Rhodovulum tesquicola]MCO8144742.1 hypothetical protein [Rhodovulum tesquicola]